MHELLGLIIAPTNESQAEFYGALQGNFSDVILLSQACNARFSGPLPLCRYRKTGVSLVARRPLGFE
jgi:hypothetical protein